MNKNKEAGSPQFMHGLCLHIPTAVYLIKSTKFGGGDSSSVLKPACTCCFESVIQFSVFFKDSFYTQLLLKIKLINLWCSKLH